MTHGPNWEDHIEKLQRRRARTLIKALRVVQLNPGCSVTDVAHGIDRSLSWASEVCSTLEGHGLVERDYVSRGKNGGARKKHRLTGLGERVVVDSDGVSVIVDMLSQDGEASM